MYSATEKISEELKANTIFAPSDGKEGWIKRIADRYFNEPFLRTTNEKFHIRSIIPVQVLSGEKKREVFQFEEIFQRCLKPPEEGVRLLLEGRPGVGKSTMMSLMTHFSGAVALNKDVEHPLYQKAKTWLRRFKLVLSIPLKELEKDCTIHWKEYIIEKTVITKKEEKEFYKTLKKLLRNREVLFLLDGFENVKRIDDEKDTSDPTGIKKILRKQDWVLTSRPDRFKVGREGQVQRFELVGLSVEGALKFIHAFFPGESEAEALIQFIAQSPHLSMIVRIPFLLEILCFSWREDKKGIFNEDVNTTFLYGLLVHKVLMKYLISHLGGTVAHLTSIEKIQTDRKVTHKTPKTCVSIFIQILERLAFRQLELGEKKYVFSRTDSNLLDLVSAEIGAFGNEGVIFEGDTKEVIDLVFDELGLFRALTDKRGEFLHSSIQEYFAGRHLATCIEKNLPVQGASWQGWVDNNRFNSEFANVFRFAVGVLGERQQIKKLDEFFTLFLDPQKASFFRFHEVCLAASFLEEVRNVELPQREDVVQRIANWIRFKEYLPRKYARYLMEHKPLFFVPPENFYGVSLYSPLLRSLSIWNHQTIVDALLADSLGAMGAAMQLCSVLQMSSEKLFDQLKKTLENPKAEGRAIGVEALGYLGIDSVKVLEILLQFSEDSSAGVRLGCIRAIEQRGGKTEDFLSANLYLKENRGFLNKGKGARSNADADSQLIHRVLSVLIERLLNDPDEFVRIAAARAIGHLRIVDTRLIDALVRGVCDSELSVGCECIMVLGFLRINEPGVQELLDDDAWSNILAVLDNFMADRAHEASPYLESLHDALSGFLAWKGILPHSERNIDHLIALSQSENNFQRLRAAFAMNSHVHTSGAVVTALVRLLGDKMVLVRFQALIALDQLEEKPEQMFDSLMEMTRSPYLSSRVRRGCIEMLAKWGSFDEKVVEKLLERQSEFPSAKTYVLAAISEIGARSPRAIEFAKATLNDQNQADVLFSIAYLFRFCSHKVEATEALLKFLQTKDDPVNKHLIHFLLPNLAISIKSIIPQICLLLNHEDGEVRNGVFVFLSQYGFDEQVQWFVANWINQEQLLILFKHNIEINSPLIYCSNTHFVYVAQHMSIQLSLTEYPFLRKILNLSEDHYYSTGIRYQMSGDRENAFQAFQLASIRDSENAYFELGYCYHWGLGVKKDKEKAQECLTYAFSRGNLEAGCFLDAFYPKKRDPEPEMIQRVPVSEEDLRGGAFFWGPGIRFRQEGDYKESTPIHFSDRTPENYLRIGKYYSQKGLGRVAFKAFEVAAEMNSSEANYELGVALRSGRFVNKDIDRSISHFTRAAEGGQVEAMFRLGAMFDFGIEVERNVRKAVQYYQMAADLGDAVAIGNLAELYQDECEIRNVEEAFRLFGLAAEQGAVHGVFGLGFCHESGEGTAVNRQIAKQLYSQAIKLGLLDLWNEKQLVYRDPRKIEVIERLKREQSASLIKSNEEYEKLKEDLEVEFEDHSDDEAVQNSSAGNDHF